MAMEKGLLLRCQPARGDLITVVPPLIITAEEIDRAVSILRDVIQQIQSSFTTRGLTVGR
jgi:adenosylmethionine-8-amino-7-oxononanoate aminotransferase